jgi:hypothetical protein
MAMSEAFYRLVGVHRLSARQTLGGLIGSLFGGTPRASADLGWNGKEFRITHTYSKNGGNKDAARSFADSVAGLLNGVVAASGAHVFDAGGVRAGSYLIKGDNFRYHAFGGAPMSFNTKDASQLINHGAFVALTDLSTRLVGGDVYVKRALSATLAQAGGDADAYRAYAAGAFEAQTLLGNIATAQDYASYLQNASVINALIAAEPESAFAVEWIVSFARVMELGLDKRWASDWTGGWGAFLDESADGIGGGEVNDNGLLRCAA